MIGAALIPRLGGAREYASCSGSRPYFGLMTKTLVRNHGGKVLISNRDTHLRRGRP